MDLSLDDVIKQKKKGGLSKTLGTNKKKTFKTLRIKKSQLKGVNLTTISDKSGPSVKKTPNAQNQQRYFSMMVFSILRYQRNSKTNNFSENSQTNTPTPFRGKPKSVFTPSNRGGGSGIKARIGSNRNKISNDNPNASFRRGRGYLALSGGRNSNKGNIIDDANGGFKPKFVGGRNRNRYSLGGPSTYSANTVNQAIRRGGQAQRGRPVRHSYSAGNKNYDDTDNSIEITFSNPRASSRGRTRFSRPSNQSKEQAPTSSIDYLRSSYPQQYDDNIIVSVQNENARSYQPEGVDIDPASLTHKTPISLNERFSTRLAFDGKDRLIQKQSSKLF